MFAQYIIICLGDWIWLAFNIFMIRYGIDYLELLWERPTISPSMSISRFWPETIIVIAYALMLSRFEELYLQAIRQKHPQILSTTRTDKVLSEKTDAELKSLLEEFMPNCGLKMKA